MVLVAGVYVYRYALGGLVALPFGSAATFSRGLLFTALQHCSPYHSPCYDILMHERAL